jgi:hypothetical protein
MIILCMLPVCGVVASDAGALGGAITYEAALRVEKDAPDGPETKKRLTQLANNYLDKLGFEAETIISNYIQSMRLANVAISKSRRGELKQEIIVAGNTGDLAEDFVMTVNTQVYTELNKAYSGQYLPVGGTILYISMPSSKDGAVTIKATIALEIASEAPVRKEDG